MEKSNLKVWVLHHYAAPPSYSGLIRPYNFATCLKNQNVHLTIFPSSYQHFSDVNLIKGRELYKKHTESNIPFVYVKTSNGTKGVRRLLNMVSYYFNVKRTAKKLIKLEGHPDVVLASSPHPLSLIAGIHIASKIKVPIVTEVRDFWPEVIFLNGKLKENSLLGKLLLKIEKWIYFKSDAIIFLKEGDSNYLKEKRWNIGKNSVNLDKCFYINNGIMFDEYIKNQSSIIYDDDINDDRFKIIYTGAVRKVNNISLILDTAKLLESEKDINFLIYGEGNELFNLKKRVINENITNVKFKGHVDRKHIPYILSKSSINLLNYSQDMYNWSRGNSSNKLFEYMASGKPIISTVKMGYSPIKSFNCGLELEKPNAEMLAEAIMHIKNLPKDEYDKISNNAVSAAKKFDYRKLSIDLLQVLRGVINEKNKIDH